MNIYTSEDIQPQKMVGEGFEMDLYSAVQD